MDHDCGSFDQSVNDGLSSILSSLSYSSVDDELLGKGTCLVKVDLKHAYRQIPASSLGNQGHEVNTIA